LSIPSSIASLNHYPIKQKSVLSWKSFDLGILPDFEARLSIFYSGFKAKDADIEIVPNVDRDMLENAINEFEGIINTLT
jgi:hypothetical protein